MENTPWLLLSTVTTGMVAPVTVLEIAGQRMRGWNPTGVPFRRLLNHNVAIPSEVTRVHGYTREMLERDGESALVVYASLREYVGELPLVSYHLEHDLEQALLPEWKRLGVPTMGRSGFSGVRLAQRLLDPVPAGNCKLQTLKEYFRLPERKAHTASGDVETVADLFSTVLRPLAEQRGILGWTELVAYATEEWYPSRFAFGKFKGRDLLEAEKNPEIRNWLAWLADSSNARTASMGRWYLRELERGSDANSGPVTASAPVQDDDRATPGIVVYLHPDLPRYRALVAAARARLAELEADFIPQRSAVSALQAKLFKRLRPLYEKRDRLRLVVSYRRTFLDTLLRQGAEEAQRVEAEFHQAERQTQEEYQQTEAKMDARREITVDEADELKSLWRKLVKLFHPDRFMNEPERLETYTNLTAAINQAKANGDLETLRKIADDPMGYVLRQGWTAIDLGDSDEVEQLRRLWERLEAEILSVLEARNDLRESPDWELLQRVQAKPEFFDHIVELKLEEVTEDLVKLEELAKQLAEEIHELHGDEGMGIA